MDCEHNWVFYGLDESGQLNLVKFYCSKCKRLDIVEERFPI